MINRQAGPTAQAGTSVLAALVFVAIFVLFISGYKIASQPADSQSAAAASTVVTALPSVCIAGDVHTVNMSSGAGTVRTLQCPEGSQNGACVSGVPSKCVIRYCPPSTYASAGVCFKLTECDPADNGDMCVRTAIQNATQPVQAASILAARLIDDKGETAADVAPLLKDTLTQSGRDAITSIIEATADAAEEGGLDAAPIRDISKTLSASAPVAQASGPVAQISCQPKIAQSGMKVAVAFGCANSVMSSSDEFSTGGRLWGATEVRLDPGLPNGTMIYGLRCSDGRKVVSATCAVAVAKPLMLLTSQSSPTGEALAWVTRGMDICELNASGNADLTASFGNPVPQSGAIALPRMTSDTEVSLTCTSVNGDVKEAKTTLRAN
jgi:hypothetical protein